MKIVARLNKEDQELVNDLRHCGISAKLVKGGVIAELPVRVENQSYDLPTQLNGAALYLDVAEHGGGMTNTGDGTVVCGLSGKALHPYYRPRGGNLSCGTHAYFSVSNAVVTVTGYRKDANIKIQEHKIVRDGIVVDIKSEELWSGELEVLPDLFSRFRAAAEAAHEKANCYHCRCVHYFTEMSVAASVS